METLFSDVETRFVLGEMIKASSIDVHLLVDFIKNNNVEQNWMYMQLPVGKWSHAASKLILQSSNGTGRNMHQCMGVVEKMLPVQYPTPPIHLANLKRKSLSELSEQPIKRQAVAAPPSEPPMAQRIIQPRPPLNGYPPVMTANPTTTTTSSLTSTGKKRGRPSKADKEAQARATYPRSTEYAPITPAPLAPINIAPQRDYVSSPGYEVSGSPADPRSRMRGRINATESSPTGLAYPLKSPASITDVPRALPEPIEHVERSTLSPQERGALAADANKSPAFQGQHIPNPPPPPPQQQQQPHLPHPTPSMTSQYTAAAPRQSPYDLPRGGHDSGRSIDPIFPDRDRSRSVSEHISRDMSPPQPPQPPSSVTNRT
ncbi:hypothetical protein PG993_006437 [Apiospora rasikravindrae]|uniref:Uncharacterized protein n=1 Tax=Apiospora rasikravindrae TaxID=990691 RepID=A0ABR1T7T8_9PEZI